MSSRVHSKGVEHEMLNRVVLAYQATYGPQHGLEAMLNPQYRGEQLGH